jgi:hypothetical protein
MRAIKIGSDASAHAWRIPPPTRKAPAGGDLKGRKKLIGQDG